MTAESKPKSEKKPKLKLVGLDGNALSILGNARRAGLKAGWTTDKLVEFQVKCMSGDYDNLLATCCEYFDVS